MVVTIHGVDFFYYAQINSIFLKCEWIYYLFHRSLCLCFVSFFFKLHSFIPLHSLAFLEWNFIFFPPISLSYTKSGFDLGLYSLIVGNILVNFLNWRRNLKHSRLHNWYGTIALKLYPQTSKWQFMQTWTDDFVLCWKKRRFSQNCFVSLV